MNHWLIPADALVGLAGSICGAVLPTRFRLTAAALITSVAAGIGLLASVLVLSGAEAVSFHSSQVIPLTGVSFSIDRLGALFTATIAVVSLCSSVYAIGYGGPGLSSRRSASVLPLFVTSMLLVPAAASMTTFLFVWEAMALGSLVLVLADHAKRPEVASAGQWYGVLTQVGAAAILLALLLLSTRTGNQSFTAIRLHAHAIPMSVRSAAFVLAAIGFGSKAGAVPLHVWLPRAHPEAPGPISALMSAGMVNLGIYGLVRVGIWMLPGGPSWWWIALITIGAASALFGVLHSSTETDLKRLLAYSTTDNLGLVLLGVGASGLFAATGHRTLSAVALLASLLHVVFHAGFKGVLFLAAGSMQKATGTKDLDRLGGLLSTMPVTGLFFLIGGMTISALPPFSGFVSEWLLLQAFLHGSTSHNTYLTVAMPLAVAVFALTGGLTMVTFTKAIGIALLGRPRSEEAGTAVEVPASMWIPTGLLASSSLVFGIAPFLLVPSVLGAVRVATGSTVHSPLQGGWQVGLSGVHGGILPLAFAVLLVVAIVAVAGGRKVSQRGPVRHAEPWGCGREIQTARMQYTATSFAEPLVRVFDDVLRPDHDLDVSHSAESRFYIEAIAFHTEREDAFERHAYRPAGRLVAAWGDIARRVPNGNIHRYLAFGMAALIVVLILFA